MNLIEHFLCAKHSARCKYRSWRDVVLTPLRASQFPFAKLSPCVHWTCTLCSKLSTWALLFSGRTFQSNTSSTFTCSSAHWGQASSPIMLLSCLLGFLTVKWKGLGRPCLCLPAALCTPQSWLKTKVIKKKLSIAAYFCNQSFDGREGFQVQAILSYTVNLRTSFGAGGWENGGHIGKC